ncbi:hypothetical protein TRICI_004177 [Trichomonascus ciferrii]|uniref:F-box domain-containing protein n=1 Tax=Trichomonascus ciferrii TaxID=44093 RepID=A0A642V1D9_9ASCO|nr:hypothetical protein TRICI_004177 [Trichomonascus ciferrii]
MLRSRSGQKSGKQKTKKAYRGINSLIDAAINTKCLPSSASVSSCNSSISSKSSSKRSIRSCRPIPSGSAVRLASSRLSINRAGSRNHSPVVTKRHRLGLTDLPVEILEQVFTHLSQRDLVKIICLSKQLYHIIQQVIYRQPQFTSTYRVAQFVSAVTKKADVSSLVYELDLSTIEAGLMNEDGLILAGWRDWKLRSEPLYSTSRFTKALLSVRSSSNKNGHINARNNVSPATIPTLGNEHPIQSPLLKQFSQSKDIPSGALIHALTACRNLTVLDLSYLPLADDYFVVAKTKLVFVSDVVRSNTWKDSEVRQVNPSDIIDCLIPLNNLTILRLKKVTWITKGLLKRFLSNSLSVSNGKLQELDLRDAGMFRHAKWAVQTTPTNLLSLLD